MLAAYTATVFLGNTRMDIPQIGLAVQTKCMKHLERLAFYRKRKGLTQAALAEQLGVEQPTVQRWEKGKREPSLGQLLEMAKVLGVSVATLLDPISAAPIGPRLFVKGEVAAGLWRNALEKPKDEWESFAGRPDIEADDDFRFGLRVVGDSMNKIYPPGTIVECVSVFGHVEPEPGKRVVVIRKNTENEVEATVKELVDQDGEYWLLPRSTNPSHAPIKVSDPGPDIVEIRIAAVVVASVRPE